MNWLEQLRTACDTHERGIAGVAEQLEMSRTALSLVLNDKYPAKLDKIERKVREYFERFECPHLCEQISMAQCRSFCLRPVPVSSAREARHWRACQSCARKPADIVVTQPAEELSHAA